MEAKRGGRAKMVYHWTIDLKHGAGALYRGLPAASVPRVDMTVALSTQTLDKCLAQKLDIMSAVLTRRLRMSGPNQGALMKLQVLKPLIEESRSQVMAATAAAAAVTTATENAGCDEARNASAAVGADAATDGAASDVVAEVVADAASAAEQPRDGGEAAAARVSLADVVL